MASVDVIYGLFPEPAAAERGMESLRSSGIDPHKVVVMSSEPFEEYSFATESQSYMPWMALIGGIIGASTGIWFCWYSQTSYPIVTAGMPIFTLWPVVIIAYELAMLGAIIASLITLGVTAKLPNWKRKFYDPEVSNGMVLIGVFDPPEAVRTDLENRLRRAGAEKVKTAAV